MSHHINIFYHYKIVAKVQEAGCVTRLHAWWYHSSAFHFLGRKEQAVGKQ